MMMKHSFKIIAICALSACTTTETPPINSPQTPPAQEAPTAPTEAQIPAPVVPEWTVSDLEKANPADIQAMLGNPTLVRRDGNVQVMLFETNSCVLDITLLETAPGDYYRAHHITARTKDGSALDANTCISQLLTQ